jgi:hypothetical protein
MFAWTVTITALGTFQWFQGAGCSTALSAEL